MTRRLVSVAVCLRKGCDWSVTGTPDKADTEARRHSGELVGGPTPPHPTSCSTHWADQEETCAS